MTQPAWPRYVSPSRRGTCTHCGTEVQVTKTSATQPYCLPCRRAGAAPSKIPCGTVNGYGKKGCRCSECTAANSEAKRAYHARRRAEGRAVKQPTVSAVCEHCAVEFQARRDNVKIGKGRFCSISCVGASQRVENGRRAEREARRARKPSSRQRAERRAAEASKGSSGRTVWTQGACAVCDGQFAPSRGAKYCSVKCKRIALKDSRWIDYATRKEIYRAANWRCAICDRETLRKYEVGNPLSPTLDHIVPRARGGADDPSNLRLCCSACNSLRGDLTYHSDESVRLARAA